jgi:hypothetical protein
VLLDVKELAFESRESTGELFPAAQIRSAS